MTTQFNFPSKAIEDSNKKEIPVSADAVRATSRKMPFKSPLWAQFQDGHEYLLFIKTIPSPESGQSPFVLPWELNAAEDGQTSYEPHFNVKDIEKPEWSWYAKQLAQRDIEIIPEQFRDKYRTEPKEQEASLDDEARDSIFGQLPQDSDLSESEPQKQVGRPKKAVA